MRGWLSRRPASNEAVETIDVELIDHPEGPELLGAVPRGPVASAASAIAAVTSSPPDAAPLNRRKRPRGEERMGPEIGAGGAGGSSASAMPAAGRPEAGAPTVAGARGSAAAPAASNQMEVQEVCKELAQLVDKPLAGSLAAAAASLPACVICRQLPIRPAVAALCGHFACGDCWACWVAHKFECPVCRRKVRPNNLIRVRGWGEP
uniref:RING-type domain-containing protein n=1 Tax=Alexandrium catenella TaxID=2925 RepID=A0A7S1MRJ0_ALECA